MLDAGQVLTFPVRRQYRHITLIQFTACIVHEPPTSLWPGYLHINFSTHEIFSSLTCALHKNMHSGIIHFCFVVISYWQILPMPMPLQNCLIYHLQRYSMKIRNTCICHECVFIVIYWSAYALGTSVSCHYICIGLYALKIVCAASGRIFTGAQCLLRCSPTRFRHFRRLV